MQAFLWRHLVPAEDLMALVYSPSYQPPPERVPPELTDEQMTELAPKTSPATAKFTKRQVAGRLRQLKSLYDEWMCARCLAICAAEGNHRTKAAELWEHYRRG